MDNTRMYSDHLGAEDVTSAIKKLGSTIGNEARAIRNRAKAKEAQSVADSGQYWTLRPFLKYMIPIPQYIYEQVKDKNISEYAVLQLTESQAASGNIIPQLQTLTTQALQSYYKVPAGTPDDVAALRTNIIKSGTIISPETGAAVGVGSPDVSGATKAQVAMSNIKAYIPWILGAVVLGLVIYFIVKKS